MSDIAIHVENLGKQYRIGERQRYKALRDTLSNALYAPFRATASLLNVRNGYNTHQSKGSNGSLSNQFWALKDISFEIKKSEAVGIIGPNGAGKSTLLKILSRITKPTAGYVRMRGRVGSLLEVGTGFHPELTGRENIYLNGSIIGMKKSEIDRKFDEIVAFAEIEKFIDTPVKFYSSGMYVRLAFAVAAHLEPEILIVDEVLAVGDAAFQKKCLGKMGQVTGNGRTVLFVSHNMNAIEGLCPRSFLLNKGEIVCQGGTKEVVFGYQGNTNGGKEVHHCITDVLHWGGLTNRNQLRSLSPKDDLELDLRFESGHQYLKWLHVDIAIRNIRNEVVIHGKSKYVGPPTDLPPYSKCIVHYRIKSPKLAPGNYYLTIYACSGDEVLFWADGIECCSISSMPYFGVAEWFDAPLSSILPEYEVEFERNNDCALALEPI